jgi:hypothetical protein
MDPKTYFKVFARNEFSTVVSGGRKFIILILISVISLWSIGFSAGTSKYLKDKMDSPFVKFLTVDIPMNKATRDSYINNLEQTLKDSANKSDFGITSHSFTAFYQTSFYRKGDDGSSESAKIRMVKQNDELYSFLREKGFISSNALDLNSAPYSIVVTSLYLESLGYNKESGFPGFIQYRYKSDGEEFTVPIGIAAIVDQLPDKCDILCTERFYPELAKYTTNHVLDPRKHGPDDLIFAFKNTKPEVSLPWLIETRNFKTPTFRSGKAYRIKQGSIPNNEIKEELTKAFGDNYLKIFDFASVYSDVIIDGETLKLTSNDKIIYDKLIVEFEMSSLEKVMDFQEFMLSENNAIELGIDMELIEARNNFMTFNSVSIILSNVLVIISIGFIVVVVIQTLLTHINRNSKNLGTLKAFGMSNQVIGITYASISLVMILIVYLSSAFILLVGGELVAKFIASMVNLNTGSASLFDSAVLLTYLPFFTLLPLITVVLTIWRKIRNETPGDLIYER